MNLPNHFHPKTGLHYVMELPSDSNVPIADVRALYQEFASRQPWLSTLDRLHFNRLYDEHAPETNDPRYFFVLWDVRPFGPPRKAFYAPVYLEALGGQVLPEHEAYEERFVTMARSCDAIFGHTPWVMSEVAFKTGRPGYTLPLGWSPGLEVVTSHDKTIELAWHGIVFGRREALLRALEAQIEVPRLMGFGADIFAKLAETKANLLLPHCHARSFSTWRIWQLVAVGTTALFAEPGDGWPMEAEHFLPLSPIRETSIGPTIREIRYHLKGSDLLGTAARMRADLGPEFTVDRCIEDWLIPASERMLEARR